MNRYKQEARLSQRDRATRFHSWRQLLHTVQKSYFKRLSTGAWRWRSLKVIGNGAIH